MTFNTLDDALPNDWQTRSLEDCMEAIIDYRGKTPKKTTHGIPLITAKIVKDGVVQPCTEFISVDSYDAWMRRGIPKAGDIIITTEAPLGEVAVIPEYTVALAQRLIVLRGDSELLENSYLRYAMQSDFVQNQLRARESGTTVTGIKQSELRKVQIPLPPLKEQNLIAQILGALDDKIELNREMNETLESMARALFKCWFVDFEPVRMKAEGKDPSAPISEGGLGLDSAISALFPDSFQDSELGEIPRGWKPTKYGDLLSHTIGGDWGKELPDDDHLEKVVIIRGTDIPKLAVGQRSAAPTRYIKASKLKTRKLKDGDIVIEISGGSTDQPTGRSLYITNSILNRLGGVVAPTSFCRLFRPASKAIGLFASIHLRHIYDLGLTWDYQNQSTGISNFQSTEFLEREVVAVPKDERLLQAFYEIVRPLVERAQSNESLRLERLRDTLLPRLLSGEIEVQGKGQ